MAKKPPTNNQIPAGSDNDIAPPYDETDEKTAQSLPKEKDSVKPQSFLDKVGDFVKDNILGGSSPEKKEGADDKKQQSKNPMEDYVEELSKMVKEINDLLLNLLKGGLSKLMSKASEASSKEETELPKSDEKTADQSQSIQPTSIQQEGQAPDATQQTGMAASPNNARSDTQTASETSSNTSSPSFLTSMSNDSVPVAPDPIGVDTAYNNSIIQQPGGAPAPALTANNDESTTMTPQKS